MPTTTAEEVRDAVLVSAVLEGGPADLPLSTRLQRTPSDAAKLKIPFRGGWEHFERAAGQSLPLVFRWVMRTRIAE
ncbi:MAG: DUF5988 family protein [Kineosporiaceae bacterium]